MKLTQILVTLSLMISMIIPMEVSSVSSQNIQQLINTSIPDSSETYNPTSIDIDRLAAQHNAQKNQIKQVSKDSAPEKELIGEFKLSFYTPSSDETDASPLITASGTRVRPGITVAVDPRYWKFGTKFYIEGHGCVIAEDTGANIKGSNIMDVSVATKDEAFEKGIQYRKVWVIKA